jgi:hypothetical protein
MTATTYNTHASNANEAPGRAKERARIVAYLRSVADQYEIGDAVPLDDYSAEAYRDAADRIESGAHMERDDAEV